MRSQTVHRDTNHKFYSLLEAFESLTGYPLLVNTLFNIRGEPIFCSPEDVYRCFMRSPRRLNRRCHEGLLLAVDSTDLYKICRTATRSQFLRSTLIAKQKGRMRRPFCFAWWRWAESNRRPQALHLWFYMRSLSLI